MKLKAACAYQIVIVRANKRLAKEAALEAAARAFSLGADISIQPLSTRRCRCGALFALQGQDKIFCSTRCRVRAHRAAKEVQR